MDIKKIASWIGLALLVVLVIFMSYYWYSHRSGPNTQDSLNGNPFPGGTSNSAANGAGGTVRPPPTINENGEILPTAESESRLFQIHDMPIVSAVAFMRQNIPFARFMEQGSGNVFEYNFDTKQKVRISNTSIPEIGEARWSANGTTIAFRYEQDNSIRTAIGLLASSTEEGAFGKITFLPEAIRSVAVSPDGEGVFYIAKGSTGSSGVVVKKDGTSPRILFTSPLTQWSVSWPSNAFVIISSPSGDNGGVSYKVALKDGGKTILSMNQAVFNEFIGDTKGQLLGVNPATNKVSLFDQRNSSFSGLETTTWPSKCTFVEGATSTILCAALPVGVSNYQDDWGRGEYSSDDLLISTNFIRGYKQFLVPQDDLGDKKFDIEKISIVPKGNYLVFKNKTNGMLWGVRVPGGIE